MAEPEEKSQPAKAQPSKNATPAKGTQRGIAAQEAAKKVKPAGSKNSPRWWAPLMVALMIIGLVIVVLAYVFSGDLPIPGWGNYNLFLGIGIMLLGFLMTMGWK